MGFLGNLIGQGAGHILGGIVGGKQGSDLGARIGGLAGSELLPFSRGGMVKKSVQPAILHKGEMVVPKHLVKKVSKSLKKEIKMGGGRNM